jgi:hypothetical protein
MSGQPASALFVHVNSRLFRHLIDSKRIEGLFATSAPPKHACFGSVTVTAMRQGLTLIANSTQQLIGDYCSRCRDDRGFKNDGEATIWFELIDCREKESANEDYR